MLEILSVFSTVQCSCIYIGAQHAESATRVHTGPKARWGLLGLYTTHKAYITPLSSFSNNNDGASNNYWKKNINKYRQSAGSREVKLNEYPTVPFDCPLVPFIPFLWMSICSFYSIPPLIIDTREEGERKKITVKKNYEQLLWQKKKIKLDDVL